MYLILYREEQQHKEFIRLLYHKRLKYDKLQLDDLYKAYHHTYAVGLGV